MCAVCVLLAGTSPCTKFLRLVPSCVPTLMEIENGENGWGGEELNRASTERYLFLE